MDDKIGNSPLYTKGNQNGWVLFDEKPITFRKFRREVTDNKNKSESKKDSGIKVFQNSNILFSESEVSCILEAQNSASFSPKEISPQISGRETERSERKYNSPRILQNQENVKNSSNTDNQKSDSEDSDYELVSYLGDSDYFSLGLDFDTNEKDSETDDTHPPNQQDETDIRNIQEKFSLLDEIKNLSKNEEMQYPNTQLHSTRHSPVTNKRRNNYHSRLLNIIDPTATTKRHKSNVSVLQNKETTQNLSQTFCGRRFLKFLNESHTSSD
ncbi:hypothetical protein GPJ56_005190 [Histomonas meleagridis]|uniref:uncharacterized protein n=1 Tax=Histomonas meleagridis TaxID=135588 RepID=UPI003559E5D7|nr:hypothetical protein GPJ56_005190 [Histomonas meleagridis]KAH0802706.1 hypothetical protein GO595_004755 [Histomonas meleagridis]